MNHGSALSWSVGMLVWTMTGALASQSGDVNRDGRLDATDAGWILGKSVSTVTLTPDATAAADVNQDGQVDARDAILVLQKDLHPAGWKTRSFRLSGRRTESGVTIAVSAGDAVPSGLGPVLLRVLDLTGKVVGRAELSLQESGAGRAAAASVALPEVKWASDLASYVVEVSAGDPGQTHVLRQSLHQIVPRLAVHVSGPPSLAAGGQERLRVVANDLNTGEPIAGARVEVALAADPGAAPSPVYRGETDGRGVAQASFQVPSGLARHGRLQVRVVSDGSERVIEQAVELLERFSTLLTTDKPLYQPGQTMHLRALTLEKPEMLPAAGRDLVLTVADSKGNKVFREVKRLSEFGIASAEFTLADELNLGTYTISAAVGDQQVEKQVTVSKYSLPKFKVGFEPDRTYYLPGGKVSGKVSANYFFGKPVSGGTVTLSASKFDVEFTPFAQVTGTTDAEGNFSFTLNLPEHFVGQPLEQGQAFAKLELKVEDGAAQAETLTRTLPVAARALRIQAVPESGRLVAGVENRVYLLTTYPDNKPARATCTVRMGGRVLDTTATDEVGIGIVRITPVGGSQLELDVEARDASGNRATGRFPIEMLNSPDALLLRTDRTLYRVGDDVLVDVFGGALGGAIFVDVIQEGQTLFSRSLDPEQGHAAMVLPLTPEMAGTIRVSAYRITARGDTLRDRKTLYVDPANQLRLTYQPNKDTYLPGEEASIRVRVSDQEDKPVLAAVGLNIVDESVFALQEMQPGMEKVYFYLEEQLRRPRYEIHGFEPDTLISNPEPEEPSRWRDQALGMIFAVTDSQEPTGFVVFERGNEDPEIPLKLRTGVWADLDLLIASFQSHFIRHPSDRTEEFFDTLFLKAVHEGSVTEETVRDPWGTLYRIHFSQPIWQTSRAYSFRSAGPDQRLETEDDVVIWASVNDVKDASARQRLGLGTGSGVVPPIGFDTGGGGIGFDSSGTGSKGGASAGVYVRQFFPETLYSNPNIITGPDGTADLKLKVADSITSWRMTGLASSARGQLGSATGAFRVFQEFFVDLDLPRTLTRGDEISIPVAIYNYLSEPQDIRLVMEKAGWFEPLGETERTVRILANQVSVAHFPIRTLKVGQHRLQVSAFGSARNDALIRQIEVVPEGQEVLVSHGGRLQGMVGHTIHVPENAIEGSGKILVKIYPGLSSQVVEGLDSLLQMPSGCFEQTSSTTYPNVLALLYMKTTGQITPEIRMKAEGFIATGYQRLLSFEVTGGGFEWFGREPAHNVLTTYGLMQFADMSQVWYVDPAVIQRTQEWLVRDQKANGSWVPTDGGIAEGAIDRFQNDTLRTTAYIVWGLSASGYSGPALASGKSFIRAQLARTDLKPELYTLALCAHALLSDPGDPLLPKLFEQFEAGKRTEGEKVWWESASPTLTFTAGKGAHVELTALLAQAYLRHGQLADTAGRALNYLISAKDPSGNFGATQATVLALKAFAMAAGAGTAPPNAVARITINGVEAGRIELNEENKDLLFLHDLQPHTRPGDNVVNISLEGTGGTLYQIVGRSHIPWEKQQPAPTEPIRIDVDYDKAELTTRDTVRCTVRVANQRSGKARMVVIDVGIPPGFEVLAEDLNALVGTKFEKYQLTPRQGIFYLDELAADKPVEFSYRLAAKFPIRALTPQSVVYEYYTPEVRAVSAPKTLTVTE